MIFDFFQVFQETDLVTRRFSFVPPNRYLSTFVLFCFVLFCFVLFCFVLFCFVLFYFIYFDIFILFTFWIGIHKASPTAPPTNVCYVFSRNNLNRCLVLPPSSSSPHPLLSLSAHPTPAPPFPPLSLLSLLACYLYHHEGHCFTCQAGNQS